MEEKYFVIYKDLIVREYAEIIEEQLIDSIGIIKYEETNVKFFPNFFSKSKQGNHVLLWKASLMNPLIHINPYFMISDVFETTDSKSTRHYYRELVIMLIRNNATR